MPKSFDQRVIDYIDDHGLKALLTELADICDDNATDDITGSIEWTEAADELREMADNLSI